MRTTDEKKLESLYESIDEQRRKDEYNKFLFNSLSKEEQQRYTIIPDLEGPQKLRTGKIVYYDSTEGKYYDRDKDMYMDSDEIEAHMNFKPRTSLKEWDQSDYRSGDENLAGSPWYDSSSDDAEIEAMEDFEAYLNEMEGIEVISSDELENSDVIKYIVKDTTPGLEPEELTDYILAKFLEWESDEDGNTAVISYIYVDMNGEKSDHDTFRT